MADFMNVKQRKPIMLTIGGHEFDLGFIPAGVEIPLLDEFHAQVEKQGSYSLPENFTELSGDEQMQARMKSAQLYAAQCAQEARINNIQFLAIFTSFFEPEIDTEYLSKHESGAVIDIAWRTLETVIIEDYYGVIADLNKGKPQSKKAKASAKKKTN